MAYQLYYWSGIQGRGEFVRLALEDAGAPYDDLARTPGGDDAMLAMLRDGDAARLPFAPPFLRDGGVLVGQTANILLYLGHRLGLAPADEAGRLWVHQLQLTVADFLAEVHDTHHPVASSRYYEDQKDAALLRARAFREERVPKYLGYFERVLARNGGRAAGDGTTYVDLSLFQVVAGMRYAFPRTMQRVQRDHPHLVALHDIVRARPRIAAYLASPRRIAFNQHGLFRHYPELDP